MELAFTLAVCGVLLGWLFWLVRSSIHPSRSVWRGYVGSLAILVSIVAVTAVFVAMLTGRTGAAHYTYVSAMTGGIIASITLGWQACKVWLKQPA